MNNNEVFDNKERTRYYGKRIGDIIEYPFPSNKRKGKVIDYGVLDNNSLFVLFEGDTFPIKVVAEWCTILKKVENFETDSKP